MDGARPRDARGPLRAREESWEAEKTTINGSKSEHGEKCYRYTTDSYRVVRCPLYVPDRRTRAKSAMPEWAMQAANA